VAAAFCGGVFNEVQEMVAGPCIVIWRKEEEGTKRRKAYYQGREE
jgi:hypothetical protein